MVDSKSRLRPLLLVYGGLLILLTLTVLASQFDLGRAALAVAMGIALAKAALIIWFYMEIKHAPKVTVFASIIGFIWLSLLLILTFSDYLTRGSLHVPGK